MIERMLRDIRYFSLILCVGTAIGFTAERRNDAFLDTLFDAPQIADMVARGFCGTPDERGKLAMIRCQDGYAIAEIRARDVEADKLTALVESTSAGQPKRRRP